MRVSVSFGEAFDKWTILSIKMDKIEDPSKVANVKKEHDSLLESLRESGSLSKVQNTVDELREVNLLLWGIEDGIRLKEAKKEFDSEFIELARSVYRMNDLRFRLKSDINTILGSELKEEKQHVAY